MFSTNTNPDRPGVVTKAASPSAVKRQQAASSPSQSRSLWGNQETITPLTESVPPCPQGKLEVWC